MPNASPTWGTWVTHYDSSGQAETMAPAFSPDNTVLTLLFDRMVISLQGGDAAKRAASIVLAGHYPLQLPDEFLIRGCLLLARGSVIKSHDASAVLTVSIGECARVLEWPPTSKIIDLTPGRKSEPQLDIQEYPFSLECFTGVEHVAHGDPRTFPPQPPLTVAIGMHARRRAIGDSVDIRIESMDLVMLSIA